MSDKTILILMLINIITAGIYLGISVAVISCIVVFKSRNESFKEKNKSLQI